MPGKAGVGQVPFPSRTIHRSSPYQGGCYSGLKLHRIGRWKSPHFFVYCLTLFRRTQPDTFLLTSPRSLKHHVRGEG